MSSLVITLSVRGPNQSKRDYDHQPGRYEVGAFREADGVYLNATTLFYFLNLFTYLHPAVLI